MAASAVTLASGLSDRCFSEMRRVMTRYGRSFQVFHLHMTVDNEYSSSFSEWCERNGMPTTTIVLPYGKEEYYRQTLTTIKVSRFNSWKNILNSFWNRWGNGEIIGYKIEGKGFDRSVDLDDFKYVELHGTDLVDTEEFKRTHYLSYSIKRGTIMYAKRIPLYDKKHNGDEICLLDLWTKDIEANWKTTAYEDQLSCLKRYIIRATVLGGEDIFGEANILEDDDVFSQI